MVWVVNLLQPMAIIIELLIKTIGGLKGANH